MQPEPVPMSAIRRPAPPFLLGRPESNFDEMFGFGAGNQNVRSDFEREAPEFLFAGEMLYGNAGDAAVEKILIRERFFGGEFGFGV